MDFSFIHLGLPLWAVFILMGLSGVLLAWFFQAAALWLMFNPKEFKGWRIPLFRKLGLHQLGLEGLGWQGLVPHQKAVMAEIAVRLMTHKLLPLDEMIKRIPAQGLSDRLTPPMQETADFACREVMLKHKPTLWESLPSFLQNSIIFKIRAIVPEVSRQIILDLQKKPAYYLSLKTLVLEVITSKPFLVVDLFKSAGKDPMAYLIRFSLLAGLVVGLLLVVASLFGLQWYWLLVLGAIAGGLANELALESLFFHPDHGTVRLGKFTGFFFRDQRHISKLFAQTAARDVLTTENIVLALCRGPNSKNLSSLIDYHVQRVMDMESSGIKPLLVAILGAEQWVAIKRDAASIFAMKLESHLMAARVYLNDALRIEEVIVERLSALPALEFEKALRPVFSRYEWMMPLIGGVWGTFLGAVLLVLL
ncbi:hypothetical protein EV673_0710 [Limnobacter thiooxidans]|uniref:DUF445 family protein n=1 Tax=Limnobacter thiooxidans TaxID=131080 RepID=A0AA86J218_9BURK|nr:hypothetical protein EV673_0710 [Limnobacter thiooxidans]BET26191.1 DUF445 family protein [Limnobacter thiooxidans]